MNTRNNSKTILNFKSGYRIFLYNSNEQIKFSETFAHANTRDGGGGEFTERLCKRWQ